jgi:hypothetical protein
MDATTGLGLQALLFSPSVWRALKLVLEVAMQNFSAVKATTQRNL